MKYYTSKSEFQWYDIGVPQPVDGPLELQADDPVLAELNALYASKKPELKEGEPYEFIGMDVTIDGSESWGILNCRVNSQHTQIRF